MLFMASWVAANPSYAPAREELSRERVITCFGFQLLPYRLTFLK